MPLLTAEQCLEHCRADEDDVELLAALLASAEDAAAAYLNRAIFATEDALVLALDGLAQQAADSQAAYDSAVQAAQQLASPEAQQAALAVAQRRLADADLRQRRTLAGIVANPSILAAVRLTLGHLYANRESVVVGASAVELPLGVADLLRPYRQVMMP